VHRVVRGKYIVRSASVVRADDAAYLEKAKAYLEKVAAPVTKWDGPTSGPKAQGKKLIVYASADQRNGGARGEQRQPIPGLPG